jgi:hypothetical protein
VEQLTCGDYKIHTFTGPGTFTVTNAGNPLGSITVDYLVVAGGGGGGMTLAVVVELVEMSSSEHLSISPGCAAITSNSYKLIQLQLVLVELEVTPSGNQWYSRNRFSFFNNNINRWWWWRCE